MPVTARAHLLAFPCLSDTDSSASPHLAGVQRAKSRSVLQVTSPKSTLRRPSTPTSRRSTYITYDRGQWSYKTLTHQVRAACPACVHRTPLHPSDIHSPSLSLIFCTPHIGPQAVDNEYVETTTSEPLGIVGVSAAVDAGVSAGARDGPGAGRCTAGRVKSIVDFWDPSCARARCDVDSSYVRHEVVCVIPSIPSILNITSAKPALATQIAPSDALQKCASEVDI